jgi:hypothetical protein
VLAKHYGSLYYENLFTILEGLEWDILLGEVLQTPK